MDIAELIQNGRDGRSYEQVSRDSGGTPSGPRLQQLATVAHKNAPDPPTVLGLATGLRVTVRTVWLAAAESLGLDVGPEESRLIALMPAGTGRLSEARVQRIRDHVAAELEDQDREDQLAALATESKPTTRARRTPRA